MKVYEILDQHDYLHSGDERKLYIYITAYYKGDYRKILVVSDDTTYIHEVKYLDDNRDVGLIDELPENPSLKDMIEYSDLCCDVGYTNVVEDFEHISSSEGEFVVSKEYPEDKEEFNLVCWKIELDDEILYQKEG